MHQIKYCIDSLFVIHLFLKNPVLNVITREHLTLLAASLVTPSFLILRDSDTDSENVSLIRPSVSDGQKRCSA